ncbi:hypothetical protein HZH66_003094 [Vespula vulgaris]|uniref:PWWP domain-containing protein n=1 Tax=Vespula vulgaris TaxID=7454 RepID=A0A834NGL4_VESVU|nr:hypothetical protein HZH66_003094 [Vespula vulgaris]
MLKRDPGDLIFVCFLINARSIRKNDDAIAEKRNKTHGLMRILVGSVIIDMILACAEGVVSTVRCEGREHALGRGIKRKLESIHSMHSTLHEDQDVAETKVEEKKQWKLEVGELVWGAARGSPAWPGKVESLGPPGTMTVGVRWYGGGGTLTQVDVKALKSLSEGLEAHHRARKKFRKSRKLNMQLENAIQEAMAELDKISESSHHREKTASAVRRSSKVSSSPTTTTRSPAGNAVSKRSSKRSMGASLDNGKADQKQCR